MKRKSLKKKLGQNTAEYLIMLTLVAVATIGLFNVFGSTLRTRIAQVTCAFQGNDEACYSDMQKAGKKLSGEAKTRADKEVNAGGQGADELTVKPTGGE